MAKRKRRAFTREFKAEAVRLGSGLGRRSTIVGGVSASTQPRPATILLYRGDSSVSEYS